MQLSRISAVAAAVAVVAALTACSSSSSSVTISYERDGEQLSATTHPSSVSCDEGGVSGSAAQASGASLFTFLPPRGSASGRMTVSIITADENGNQDVVYFETENDATYDPVGSIVTVTDTPGNVILIDNWDGESDFDRSDGTEVEGTISAELHCDAVED